jgi:Na+-translocating ferredoxin:NAD+ oxidoreductase subunit B
MERLNKHKEGIYEEVRRYLDHFPIGMPPAPVAYQILRELISEEEAALFVNIPRSPQAWDSEKIAEKSGMREKGVYKMLSDLAHRGVIAVANPGESDQERFMVVPFAPGVIEYVLAEMTDTDQKRRLSGLIEKYLDSGFYYEFGSSNYPWMRVVPIEKKIDFQHEVLSFNRVSSVIEQSTSIALIACACRTVAKNCNRPVETCIILDISAEYVAKYRNARKISKDEAYKVLDETEKHGLVHMTLNTQQGSSGICSCCTCCCSLLRGLINFHNPRAFLKSNFMPEIETDQCALCLQCVEICPTKAMVHYLGHEAFGSPERITVLEDRCIGCGLCASHCPHEAITLKKVHDFIPEPTLGKAWKRFAKEKYF